VKARALPLVAIASLALALVSAAPAPAPAPRLLEEVRILTAPEMDGRASGTPGNERAARHITAVLREAGLEPPDGAAYALPFTVPTRVRLADGNALALTGAGARALALGTDWTPVGASADGTVEGEVVFVGYGISAADLSYDDYAGVDVRGKIVLALGGEPRRADASTPFARAYQAGYGHRLHKARVARDHGALALLLVHRPEGGSDTLPPVRDGIGAGTVLTAAITRATTEALLAAGGRPLATLKKEIDDRLAPASTPLPGVRARLTVRLMREKGSSANVVGVLPGTDPVLAREAVVIGAHYDHLGRTGDGSLDLEHPTQVHPGADDNASGTAGVLALARAFAAAGGTPRTLVFTLFSGEELGLLGAGAYVRQPPFPLERTVAMVNLDMIGRMRDHRVSVGGIDSGSGLKRVVTEAAGGLGIQVDLLGSPYAPTDHMSFYQHRVPVLFFHTGRHDDYHKPTDTWEKINAEGMERIVTLAARVIDRLARGPAPAWAKVPDGTPEHVGGAAYPSNGTGYFGVAPDLADDAPGVQLALVQPGTAAARAGVEVGDVVVRFDGARVYSFEDLRQAITARKPGHRVDVVYLRDGREHTTEAVLGSRP
jgi:hypothetical protein